LNAGPCGGSQPGGDAEQRRHAAERFRKGNLSLRGLWTYYLGIGGDADQLVLDAYLHELLLLAPIQMELIDAALNETGTAVLTDPPE
jgi:hypothetical protein